jgi:hypothetical protein
MVDPDTGVFTQYGTNATVSTVRAATVSSVTWNGHSLSSLYDAGNTSGSMELTLSGSTPNLTSTGAVFWAVKNMGGASLGVVAHTSPNAFNAGGPFANKVGFNLITSQATTTVNIGDSFMGVSTWDKANVSSQAHWFCAESGSGSFQTTSCAANYGGGGPEAETIVNLGWGGSGGQFTSQLVFFGLANKVKTSAFWQTIADDPQGTLLSSGTGGGSNAAAARAHINMMRNA